MTKLVHTKAQSNSCIVVVAKLCSVFIYCTSLIKIRKSCVSLASIGILIPRGENSSYVVSLTATICCCVIPWSHLCVCVHLSVPREEEAIQLDGLNAAQIKELREKSEKHAFQAEVNRMMKLIINSLYKNKEVNRKKISLYFITFSSCSWSFLWIYLHSMACRCQHAGLM